MWIIGFAGLSVSYFDLIFFLRSTMGSLKWWLFAPVVVALAFVADYGVSASISNERKCSVFES